MCRGFFYAQNYFRASALTAEEVSQVSSSKHHLIALWCHPAVEAVDPTRQRSLIAEKCLSVALQTVTYSTHSAATQSNHSIRIPAMDNEAIDELAQFCADQYYCFDAEQWMQKTTQYRRACLALAGYLSRTSWYGHSEQLDRVGTLARTQLADAAVAVNSEDQETLDIARFSARIRVRIAQMRLQVPVQDRHASTH